MSMEKAEQRKDWIDVLRAIAVLFVLYGHMGHGMWEYYVFTSPIKIPLFFAISGYLFHERDGDYRRFLKNLLLRYVIPWLFLAFTPIILYSFVKGNAWFGNSAVKILTGESVWYMPCCIVAEAIYFTVCKFIRNKMGRFVFAAAAFFVGILLTQYGILDVFMINRALGVQIFLFAGSCIKANAAKIEKLKWWILALSGALYTALCIGSLFLYPRQALDVHYSRYYNIPYCLMLIALGLFVLFAIAPRVKKYPKFLVFVGRNTLVFYIWSSYVAAAFKLCLSWGGMTLPVHWLAAVVYSVVCCIGCGICAWILNKAVPELVGKRESCMNRFNRIPERKMEK